MSSVDVVAITPVVPTPASSPASFPALAAECTYSPESSRSGCSITARKDFVPMLPVAHWTTRYDVSVMSLLGVESRVDGRELDVELVQAPKDPGRLVVEPALPGGTMVLFGEPDVAHPVEDALDADAALGARERPTGARVDAAPERDVLLRVGPVDPELGRALEPPRIAVGGAVEQHHRRARGDVDAADRRVATGETEVGLHGALDPQRLLDEVRDALTVHAELVLELGILGQVLERSGEQASGGLLAGREQEGRAPHDRCDGRRRAVGVLGDGEVREDVLARLPTAVLDVRGEVPVEPLERIELGLLLAAAELPGRRAETESLAEPLVLRLRNSEEVGDDEQREGLRVGRDELAPTEGKQLVELLVGQAPHEVLVLAEALRRDEAHQQRPLARVVRRIHRDHVLVHREVVAMGVDDLADV